MSIQPTTSIKNVINVELYADEPNYSLICKMPDTTAVGRTGGFGGNGNYYSGTSDMTIQGSTNTISVRLDPPLSQDVYSNNCLLMFCKRHIDCHIEDAVLITERGRKEFSKERPDYMLMFALFPILIFTMFEPHACDPFYPNFWKWKDNKIVISKKKRTFVDQRFVLVQNGNDN